MARSKSLLFPLEQQLLADYGLAISHPARVELLRRLLTAEVMSYNDLIEGIPLTEGTLVQHFRLLERKGFMIKGSFGGGDCGYSLDRLTYKLAVAAHLDQLEGSGVRMRRIMVIEDEA